MDTNHKPATPLPWIYDIERTPATPICTADRREWIASPFRRVGEEQDAAYIAHACNAYPRLVAALREVLAEHAGDRLNVRADFSKLNVKAQASKLLNELGE
jgi:hypothetical protein